MGGPEGSPQPGFRYEVMLPEGDAWFPEPALELVDTSLDPRWESREELRRDLLLAKLKNPLTDSLYAYGASRTDFEAYQFRPALKFLRNPNQSLLIADEVGLGKTIEAAIIYLELKARLGIDRVLVLCPSRLTAKWQDELRNRFDEQFEILDSARVQRLFEEHQRHGSGIPIRAIASFESLRREEILQRFVDRPFPLDLLIVDEAHHMRNADANTYRLGNTLVNASDAVLFLTATPLNLRTDDLFNLVNMLAPDEFERRELFAEQVQPNQYVHRAMSLLSAGDPRAARVELQKVEQSPFRQRFLLNPYYREILARLSAGVSLPRDERVLLQREMGDLNALASVFTRTRKREVAHAAERAPVSIRVRLTPEERAFYDGVLGLAQQEMRAAGGSARGFAAVMKERQAASCLIALRSAFEHAAQERRAVSLEVDRSPFDVLATGEDLKITSRDDLLGLSRRIGETDSKFDLFRHAIGGALAEDPTSKALVFSFFKGTLRYLEQRLRRLGYEVEAIHGDVKVEERRRIIERFRTSTTQRILLSSEVGAEGLDFQFCDVLVNYDLPWNPMQVEQRIGRLDRFGQQHARIRIYNLFIEDTVETRIFDRLYERIELFQHSIGDLEAILGDVVVELSRHVLQADLTPAEETRLAELAADRIVRRQKEENELDRQKDELLGAGRILDQQVDATINSGRVISPSEVQALVFTYLRSAFPRATLQGDSDEPCWTLQIDEDLGRHLASFVTRARMENRLSEELRTAMYGRGQQRIRLTFAAELANRRPSLEFVTVRHPLAELARAYWADQRRRGVPATALAVHGPEDEAGIGHFFVYVLSVSGAERRTTLEPIVLLDDGRVVAQAADALLRALQDDGVRSSVEPTDPGPFARAEKAATNLIAMRRDQVEVEMKRRNEALLARRGTSIKTSFEAKIHRTERLLQAAANENIRRMRRGEADRLRARMSAKLDELANARNVVVSFSLIAGGRVEVIPRTA